MLSQAEESMYYEISFNCISENMHKDTVEIRTSLTPVTQQYKFWIQMYIHSFLLASWVSTYMSFRASSKIRLK